MKQMKASITFLLLVISINFTNGQSNTNNDAQKDDYTTNYDWSWKQNTPVTFTPPPPDPVPIDGGIGFLLVVGLGYGLRKIKCK